MDASGLCLDVTRAIRPKLYLAGQFDFANFLRAAVHRRDSRKNGR